MVGHVRLTNCGHQCRNVFNPPQNLEKDDRDKETELNKFHGANRSNLKNTLY
jgi:hypothetical protein